MIIFMYFLILMHHKDKIIRLTVTITITLELKKYERNLKVVVNLLSVIYFDPKVAISADYVCMNKVHLPWF